MGSASRVGILKFLFNLCYTMCVYHVELWKHLMMQCRSTDIRWLLYVIEDLSRCFQLWSVPVTASFRHRRLHATIRVPIPKPPKSAESRRDQAVNARKATYTTRARVYLPKPALATTMAFWDMWVGWSELRNFPLLSFFGTGVNCSKLIREHDSHCLSEFFVKTCMRAFCNGFFVSVDSSSKWRIWTIWTIFSKRMAKMGWCKRAFRSGY